MPSTGEKRRQQQRNRRKPTPLQVAQKEKKKAETKERTKENNRDRHLVSYHLKKMNTPKTPERRSGTVPEDGLLASVIKSNRKDRIKDSAAVLRMNKRHHKERMQLLMDRPKGRKDLAKECEKLVKKHEEERTTFMNFFSSREQSRQKETEAVERQETPYIARARRTEDHEEEEEEEHKDQNAGLFSSRTSPLRGFIKSPTTKKTQPGTKPAAARAKDGDGVNSIASDGDESLKSAEDGLAFDDDGEDKEGDVEVLKILKVMQFNEGSDDEDILAVWQADEEESDSDDDEEEVDSDGEDSLSDKVERVEEHEDRDDEDILEVWQADEEQQLHEEEYQFHTLSKQELREMLTTEDFILNRLTDSELVRALLASLQKNLISVGSGLNKGPLMSFCVRFGLIQANDKLTNKEAVELLEQHALSLGVAR